VRNRTAQEALEIANHLDRVRIAMHLHDRIHKDEPKIAKLLNTTKDKKHVRRTKK